MISKFLLSEVRTDSSKLRAKPKLKQTKLRIEGIFICNLTEYFSYLIFILFGFDYRPYWLQSNLDNLVLIFTAVKI